MTGLSVKVILQDIKKLETEAVIVGFFEDVRPLKGLAGELDWLLCGSLSRLIIDRKMTGSLGEAALLTSRGKIPAKKIFMMGLGPRQGFSTASLRSAARTAAASALGAGVTNAALEYVHTTGAQNNVSFRALMQGMQDGAKGRELHVALIAPDAVSYEKIAHLAKG